MRAANTPYDTCSKHLENLVYIIDLVPRDQVGSTYHTHPYTKASCAAGVVPGETTRTIPITGTLGHASY